MRTRRFSSVPHWQATCCASTIAFAIGVIPKTWYAHREDRGNNYEKTAEHVTSSRQLDAKTHCESLDSDSQSVRIGRICQNGEGWTLLFGYGWKKFYSSLQRTLRAEKFSKSGLQAICSRSRGDRASDRNRSV